jgi:enoyl-CoA hydratase
MADPKVPIERDGLVTTAIINRPAVRNALDNEAARLLAEAIATFDADESARVLVVWGRGGAFCAGADLKEMAQAGAVYVPWASHEHGPTARLVSKPAIAAVEGHAVAGGLGLALWCDLRICDETAVFGVFSRRWGVPMSDGTTVRLPRLVGQGRALDMLLTGRPVSAQEALAIGLATRVVPKGTARAEAEALARQLAAFPQVTMNSDRRSALTQWDLPLAEALKREAEFAAQAKAEQAQAGAARFAGGAGRHGRFEDS